MTFKMVNICVQEKFPNFAIFAKIAKLSSMPNFLFYTRCVREHVFLFLKIRRKPTSPAMRNKEFNSCGLSSHTYVHHVYIPKPDRDILLRNPCLITVKIIGLFRALGVKLVHT